MFISQERLNSRRVQQCFRNQSFRKFAKAPQDDELVKFCNFKRGRRGGFRGQAPSSELLTQHFAGVVCERSRTTSRQLQLGIYHRRIRITQALSLLLFILF